MDIRPLAVALPHTPPVGQRAQAAQLYVELLHETLRELYADVAEGEGGQVDAAAHNRFFDDAVSVLGVLILLGYTVLYGMR